jgi:hypothetical protein
MTRLMVMRIVMHLVLVVVVSCRFVVSGPKFVHHMDTESRPGY